MNGNLPCKRCGGKTKHYANCPDAGPEVCSMAAMFIDGKYALGNRNEVVAFTSMKRPKPQGEHT